MLLELINSQATGINFELLLNLLKILSPDLYFIENIPGVRRNDVPAEIQNVPVRLQQPHQVGVQGDGVGAGVVPHLAPAQLGQVHPIPRIELLLLLGSLLFHG